ARSGQADLSGARRQDREPAGGEGQPPFALCRHLAGRSCDQGPGSLQRSPGAAGPGRESTQDPPVRPSGRGASGRRGDGDRAAERKAHLGDRGGRAVHGPDLGPAVTARGREGHQMIYGGVAMAKMMTARFLFFVPVLILLVLPAAAFAAPRPAVSKPNGETVDVEIKIVPFYAVDGEGKPVWDLKSNEVELRVGGKPMFVDTFDGPAAPGGAERTGSNGLRPASRNVIFLIDSAFTSPAGFRNALQVVQKLAGDVPEGDRLSLMTHTAARGLEKKLGLIRADGRGKARFRAVLGKLIPEGRRLSANAPVDMMNDVGGNDRDGKPRTQVANHIDMMKATSRSEYEGIVRQLADSLALTAEELRHLRGPKLFVVLWQGIDPELYFNGNFGVKLGSGNSVLVDARR